MAKFTLHRKPRKAGNVVMLHVVFDIQNIKKETTHICHFTVHLVPKMFLAKANCCILLSICMHKSNAL